MDGRERLKVAAIVTSIVTLRIRTLEFYCGLRRVMECDATDANPLGP